MCGDYKNRVIRSESGQPIGSRRSFSSLRRKRSWFPHSQSGRQRILPLVVWLAFPILTFGVALGTSEDAEQYFQQNCSICHTIGGGRLVGPDLKGVSERADRQWLVDFIVDPQGVIDRGDPYAQQLLEEAGGVVMPPGPGMTPQRAHELLDFIDKQSALEVPADAQPEVEEKPLTAEDVEKGRALFLGLSGLENGGAACISCHTVNGDDSLLAGGTLGPNLTDVLARLGGRPGLSGWLSGPPTPTMRATFQEAPLNPEEITSLVAFFQYQAETNPPERAAPFVNFLLFGLGGTAVLLVAFDQVWRRRFRAVRRPLVQKVTRRFHSQIELEDERASL